jgi:hypothetical protein
MLNFPSFCSRIALLIEENSMISQKDLLAKLLATENVTVLHESVPTASFDVKNRVLRLPQWDDMQSYTYDHLVGHEVGHALYTPFEGWHDSISERGQSFKSFLNVIEDARIEKLVQRKYPGLRGSFIRSYQKMFADGFFGDNKDIDSYNLIDRINVLFKCGESFGVRIDEDEQAWVDEIRTAETWDQVVDIATRMYDSELSKAEDENDFDGLDDDGDDYQDETETMSMPSDSGEESEDENEDQMDLPAPGESEEQQAGTESPAAQSIASQTDEELRENMESLNKDENDGYDNVRVGAMNAEPFIVSYKKLIERQYDDLLDQRSYFHTQSLYPNLMKDAEEEANRLYNEFLGNNKKTISYLVKEFEMRKSAAQYARATISKTGVIDPVKMNNYKFSEDIFRRVSVVPEGKNHGVVMYLDWSGSMWQDIYNTVIQTLNLVHFCRQVNIPYRVYAFSDQYYDESGAERREMIQEYTNAIPAGLTCVAETGYALLEWFNNKMTKMQFREASKKLLMISKNIEYVKGGLRLGGTPLDTTILMAMDIYNKFKKQNRLDIVNTIFLTDGDSHPASYRYQYDEYVGNTNIRGRRTRLVDDVTKKQYVNKKDYWAATTTLLTMFQDRTGGNAIGYRIVPSSKHQFMREWGDDAGWKQMLKEGFVSKQERGYSKLFLLRGGKSLQVEAGELEVDRGAKKGKLTSAFKKAAKGKLTSRTLLNEFIHEVA